jgi:hypothetical protein
LKLQYSDRKLVGKGGNEVNTLLEQYIDRKELLKRGNEVNLFLEQFSLFKV